MEGCIDHGGATPRYACHNRNGQMIGKHVSALIDKAGDQRPLRALHTCGNCRCINPDHLYWGTQSQNIQDALASKTFKPRKKLTNEEVGLILAVYIPHHPQYGGAALARQYKITPQSLNRLMRNRGYYDASPR